jgi:hypothetical protein
MITKVQADYLLSLPKHVIEQVARGENRYLDSKRYTPKVPIDDRIYLASRAEDEYTFFIEITQSSKNQFKLTLHLQEEDASIGLLRVDFNGRHKNPVIATDSIPEIFKNYADSWLQGSHIHYFFDGYKPLSWAIPLHHDSSFPIHEFNDPSQIGPIIINFGRRINLITELTVTIQTEIHELD